MVEVADRQQDAIDDVIRDAVRGSGKVNIVVAGKTGVGKSTLINTVFRGQLAKTGSGTPVTQQIEEISKDGHPITIIDSKGLELKDYATILKDLESFLELRVGITMKTRTSMRQGFAFRKAVIASSRQKSTSAVC